MRRRWMPILAALLVLTAHWLALRDGVALGTRDAPVAVVDPHTPVYFGYYHIYLFGGEIRYLAASLVCLFLGFLILFLWGAQAHRRKWPAHYRPGFCRTCGYNLTGNTSGVCPECGTVIEPPETHRPARDHS